MKYRTQKQFNLIIDSATNGNYTQAQEQVIRYGFYANDLVDMYNKRVEELGEYQYFKATDLAYLIPDKR